MQEQKTIIDSNGFVIERNVVFIDENPQFYELQENDKVVELLTKTQIVNNQNVPLLKPKWIGLEWIETATQEELNEVYPILKVEPTTDEILRAKLIKDNATIQLQLAQQQKLNADILLKLAKLGGNTNV